MGAPRLLTPSGALDISIDLEKPLICVICKGILYVDIQFNRDMRINGVNKARLSCVNDHGIIIELPRINISEEVRLCEGCRKPFSNNTDQKQRWHRECYRQHIKELKSVPSHRPFKSGVL